MSQSTFNVDILEKDMLIIRIIKRDQPYPLNQILAGSNLNLVSSQKNFETIVKTFNSLKKKLYAILCNYMFIKQRTLFFKAIVNLK